MKEDKALTKMTDIFQAQNDSKLAKKIFPNLAKNTFDLQVMDHLSKRRSEYYAQEFMNELRKRILQKKILKSFLQQKTLDYKQ